MPRAQDPASVYGLRGLLAHREGRLHHARVCLSRAVYLAPEEARWVLALCTHAGVCACT